MQRCVTGAAAMLQGEEEAGGGLVLQRKRATKEGSEEPGMLF